MLEVHRRQRLLHRDGSRRDNSIYKIYAVARSIAAKIFTRAQGNIEIHGHTDHFSNSARNSVSSDGLRTPKHDFHHSQHRNGGTLILVQEKIESELVASGNINQNATVDNHARRLWTFARRVFAAPRWLVDPGHHDPARRRKRPEAQPSTPLNRHFLSRLSYRRRLGLH